MVDKKRTVEYINGTFLGREFKAKNKPESTKIWQLFSSKFRTEMGDLKMGAFTSPKKGLCITSLIEGTDYRMGYTTEEVTFTNDVNEEVTYNRLTITFIDNVKEGMVETNNTDCGAGVIGPAHDPTMPVDTQNLLESYKQDLSQAEGVVLQSNEKEILDKLYAIPPDKMNEEDFKYTINQSIVGIVPARVDVLWLFYLKNMR